MRDSSHDVQRLRKKIIGFAKAFGTRLPHVTLPFVIVLSMFCVCRLSAGQSVPSISDASVAAPLTNLRDHLEQVSVAFHAAQLATEAAVEDVSKADAPAKTKKLRKLVEAASCKE